MDDKIKKILEDKAVQTILKEFDDKATQTDINEKGTQADIKPEPGTYQKILSHYIGPEVVDDSGWFRWKKTKKATQTLRIPILHDPIIERVPPPTPPTPLAPISNEQPLEIVDLINPLIDGFFAPLNFGLTLLNHSPANSVHDGSPPVSIHSSPANYVHSSPPISIHTSPPISVHSSSSSSKSKITSPPMSVASSHPNVLSPASPPYLPLELEPDFPATSKSSSNKSKKNK